MYPTLLLIHSGLRWLVLLSLLLLWYRSLRGKFSGRPYTPTDNLARTWATTFSHLQLLLGYALYFTSPVVSSFVANPSEGVRNPQILFFGLLHVSLMTLAVGVLTVGTAKARRAGADNKKFSLLVTYASLALLMILLAIPWPFSPLAARPWVRLP